MFKKPYDTSLMSLYRNEKSIQLIEHQLAKDIKAFKPIDNQYAYANDYVRCINETDMLEDVPLFSLPMLVRNNAYDKDDVTESFVIDCRPYSSKSRDGDIGVSKITAYQNALIIGSLTDYWYRNGPKSLTVSNKIPVRVFTSWITGTLAKRLNLDEIAQVRTSAIVAFYFLCMFADLPEYKQNHFLNHDEAYTYAVKVAYSTGLTTLDALNIITTIPTMNKLDDLASAIRDHAGSGRCRNLNSGLLFNLLGRNSLNGMHLEVIHCALEYPPIFYAMVYIAAKHRGYNKSDIGNFVHQIRNAEDVKHFIQTMDNILNNK